MSGFGKRVLQAFVRAAYPDRCLVCGRSRTGRPVTDQACFPAPLPPKLQLKRSAPGDAAAMDAVRAAVFKTWHFENLLRPFVCGACRATFTPITPPLCRRCGTLFKSRVGDSHLCGGCLRKPGRYTLARAVGLYDQVMMALVHLLKYRGKVQLARPLGRCLFAEFLRHWEGGAVDIVVPVPMHIKRWRQRGFNQAWLLVSEWCQLASAMEGGEPSFCVTPHLLERHKATKPQSGLGRAHRRANVRQTMTVACAPQAHGQHVLVVDDVLTTGATVDECARVLLAAGAARVDVLTLARVV